MSISSRKSKIVVIGAGFVGSTIAYTIMMNQVVSEIVLIDINRDKACGEALDMNHGIAFFKQLIIRDGDYDDCIDADVIIITAGVGRKPGQNRIELAKTNVAIIKDITRNIMKYAIDPIIIVVSNPVDILTYIVQKESGLPANHVFGSGTTLDSGRFRYLLSRHCRVDVRNVHGYVIGEHGDSELPVWSRTNIAGKPFSEFCEDCTKRCQNVNRELIFENTRDAGAEIISKKGATYYGIAMAVTRVVTAIMGDEHAILTVTSFLSGQYGLNDVALSLPSVINKNGIDRIIDLCIDENEMIKLHESAKKLKAVLAEVY